MGQVDEALAHLLAAFPELGRIGPGPTTWPFKLWPNGSKAMQPTLKPCCAAPSSSTPKKDWCNESGRGWRPEKLS